jgi:hypothetical protein
MNSFTLNVNPSWSKAPPRAAGKRSSRADIAERQTDVRFTPKSGHSPNDCVKLNQLSPGRIPIVGPNTLQKQKTAVVAALIDDYMR